MQKTLLFLVIFFTGFVSSGQTTLPYYTGFDNTAQKNGWQSFRLGYLGASNWVIASFNPYSTPSCIYHDYPVGSSSNDSTIDWFVSPVFDFSNGGKIDSLKVKIYSITGSATQADELSLYLLTVSNNPSLSKSLTLLAELKGMVSGQNLWRDTGNFIIPPTTGACYIGIKYRATNNWFVVSIDNIYISGKTSGLNDEIISNKKMTIYPNPACTKINITIPFKQPYNTETIITNNLGRVVLRKQIENESDFSGIDISHLTPGNYFITVYSNSSDILHQKLIILK
jgi:hypothetical protein